MVTVDNFTRVKSDVYGNPRYVIHFLDVLRESENNEIATISRKYIHAVNKMKKLGGSKYRGKDYGGGIVFQSYNIQDTANRINELLK